MRRLSLLGLVCIMAACAIDATNVVQPPNYDVASGDSLAPAYEMGNPHRIPGQYIVRFNNDVKDPVAVTHRIVALHHGKAFSIWKGINGFWGTLPPEAVEALRRNPNARYIEAAISIPADTTSENVGLLADGNWGLDRIDQRDLPLNDTYSYAYDGAGVHVWVVDTGVDDSTSELAGRIDHASYYAYPGTDAFQPCAPHGTWVAIMAAGGIHGVAKGATIYVARVGNQCSDTLDTGAIISALEYIADSAARPAVINLSSGYKCNFLGCGNSADDAVRYAISQGIQVVLSAGNDSADACDYSPAHVDEAISVGASDKTDARAGFSNYGSCVDIFAPGVNNVGGGTYVPGTSVAAPLVAGVAALYLQQEPGASPASVTAAIMHAATAGRLTNIGSGSPNKLLYSWVPITQTVVVTGPTYVNGGPGTCMYEADVFDGAPPFTYQWSGVLSGTSSIIEGQIHSSGYLQVDVWDSQNRHAVNGFWITVAPDGQSCGV